MADVHAHAGETAAAHAAHAAHDAHSHVFPPGVVALSGKELAEACAAAAASESQTREALDLRIAAIFIIAFGSALGMFLPMLLQRWRAFDKNRAPFFVLKAFGAGVILATGVIHMYPAAAASLSSPCLGWPEFPWAGFVTTFAIIGFLLLEHGVTSVVEGRLHAKLRALAARGVPLSSSSSALPAGASASSPSSSPSRGLLFGSASSRRKCCEEAAVAASKLGDAENGACSHHALTTAATTAAAAAAAAATKRPAPHTDACCPPSPEPGSICGGAGDMSIANVHGPALAHTHGHKHGSGGAAEGTAAGAATAATTTTTAAAATAAPATTAAAVAAPNSASAIITGGEDCDVALRHAAVAQVLEFGIAMHSFIIGVALGVSRDAAEIKPLLIAITFHQCFEGIALGSCFIEAEYRRAIYAALGVFYSLTTAGGVALGIGIASSYNAGSRAALGVSGVLDAVSAAILIYAALVDLIAADFLTKRFRADRKLQAGGYIALLLGAGLMALIAIWA